MNERAFQEQSNKPPQRGIDRVFSTARRFVGEMAESLKAVVSGSDMWDGCYTAPRRRGTPRRRGNRTTRG